MYLRTLPNTLLLMAIHVGDNNVFPVHNYDELAYVDIPVLCWLNGFQKHKV